MDRPNSLTLEPFRAVGANLVARLEVANVLAMANLAEAALELNYPGFRPRGKQPETDDWADRDEWNDHEDSIAFENKAREENNAYGYEDNRD